MKAFENITDITADRKKAKPRTTGLTIVMDSGLGRFATRDLVSVGGDYVDVIKLGFGSAGLYDVSLLKWKVRYFDKNNISTMTGGTLTEIATSRDLFEKYLSELKKFGFNAVEISDGIITIDDPKREELIDMAISMGFKVFSEVGKKFEQLDTYNIVSAIERDIKFGVFKVIIGSGGLGAHGIYSQNGKILTRKLDRILSHLKNYVDNVVFEAPKSHQQVYLVKKIGSSVNLGNIKPKDVIPLEALRTRLRSDTIAI